MTGEPLSRYLKERGRELGFSMIGITPAARPETLEHFREWLQQGLHGSMEYMSRRESAYAHPEGVQVGVRSLIVAAMNYGAGQHDETQPGKIAAYAQGSADYHDILRDRLKSLALALREVQPAARTRIAVDTAPLLERDAAQRAGLGWFGKNTMLINKWSGSYFFLGAVLTDCELTPDAPHESSHCGSCTRCLEACPTDAFPAPHVLDAKKCISYLTIELRDRPIPVDLRKGMGDWIFGCDVCQQVCPWNRKATPPEEVTFQSKGSELPTALKLLNLSQEEFERRYSETPLARPGWDGIARNAAIALGNRRCEEDVPDLVNALNSESSLVRGAAAWALGEINNSFARKALENRRRCELDAQVSSEIEASLEKSTT